MYALSTPLIKPQVVGSKERLCLPIRLLVLLAWKGVTTAGKADVEDVKLVNAVPITHPN